MRRREFLAGGAALGLTWACGPAPGQHRRAALAPPPARVPVVDLHCHNFNGEDIPLAAFLSGKFHNVPSWFMRANGAVFAGLAHIAAPSALRRPGVALASVWSDRTTMTDVMGGNALRFLGLVPRPDGSTPPNLARVRRHYGGGLPAWLRGASHQA